MRTQGAKAFWLAFWITLAVLAPLIGVTLLAAEQAQEAPAASSKNDVRILLPGPENRLRLLAVVADDPPAFVLVEADAQANVLRFAALPAESVVKNGQTSLTLAESYAAAGPARAAELLGATLGVPLDRYLALTPAALGAIWADAGPVRAGLSGALSPQQLAAAGLGDGVKDWTVPAAHAFLHGLDTGTDAALAPPAAAAARAALWQAWARQNLETLPAVIPDGLRSQSGTLLTDLSATDLLTLAQTLEFLAENAAAPECSALPGSWNAAARRYEFDDDTLAAAQAFFSADATSGASAGASVP